MSHLKRRCMSVIFVAGLATVIVALDAIGSNAETIGYWRFEGDDAGFLADSSGNGYTLTKGVGDNPITYPTQYTLPSSGAGAGFDDPIPLNGLANAAAASFTPGTLGQSFQHADEEMFYSTKFTVEAYIRRVADPNTTTDTIIAAQYEPTNERSWGFRIKNNAGILDSTLCLGISTNGINSQGFYSDYSLAYDTDYYVAVSFDLSQQAGGVKFYCKNLDTGEWRVSSENHTATSLHDSKAPFRIGAYYGGSSAKWAGLIDEVRWSNTVLSPDELLTPVPEPSTLAMAVIGIAGAILLLVRRKIAS